MLDSGCGCVWNIRYNMNEIRLCQMGGSAMVCVSSLFIYKYKHSCQSVSKRLPGAEQQNHGGHAVPFLMELFGKVESWHEKV